MLLILENSLRIKVVKFNREFVTSAYRSKSVLVDRYFALTLPLIFFGSIFTLVLATNVTSQEVAPSAVPSCRVQVVMITNTALIIVCR